MFRTRTIPALLAAVTAVALATVGAPVAPPAHADSTPALHVGTKLELNTLNPFNANNAVADEAERLNYQYLVGFGPDFSPTAGFATEWKQSDDGLTWTFLIDEDKTWSDGTPATAGDAAFTFQMLLDARAANGTLGIGSKSAYIRDVASVEALSDTELTITTTRATHAVLTMLVPIVPKHVWEKVGWEAVADFDNPTPIVGSGPYQAVDWQPGQTLAFNQNVEFDGTRGDASEVYIEFFGSQDTMFQAFQSGSLDYVHELSPDQFESLSGRSDIVTIEAPSRQMTHIAFNTFEPEIPDGGASTDALEDPAFRSALDWAVDQDEIIKRVLRGYAVAETSTIPTFFPDDHLVVEDVRGFDIDRARAELTGAGYNVDADGNLLDLEDKPIRLRMFTTSGDADATAISQMITQWWGELGIKVEAQALDRGTIYQVNEPPVNGGDGTADYDTLIFQTGSYADTMQYLRSMTSAVVGLTSDNQYMNPEYDALYDRAFELTGEDLARAKQELQQIIYDDAPVIRLYSNSILDAYWTDTFDGWQRVQPEGKGTPLFALGAIGYVNLTLVDTGASTDAAGAPGWIWVAGAVLVLAVILVWVWFSRRRRESLRVDDD